MSSRLPTLGMVTASSLGNVTRPQQKTFRPLTRMRDHPQKAIITPQRRSSLRVSAVNTLRDVLQKRQIGETPSWRSISGYGSFRSAASSEPNTAREGRVFTIVLESNWGSPDTLTLAAVSFLNIERHQIPTLSVTSFPELPETAHVDCLMNPTLVKTSIFTARWPPENGSTISLVFVVDQKEPVSYVRMFNASESGAAGVRNVTIRCGSEIVFQGEIPKSFGTDAKLAPTDHIECEESHAVLQELFPRARKCIAYEDAYGSYPVEEVTTLRIELVSNYSKDCCEANCGLNGIELFDYDGKTITPDDVEEVTLDNGKCVAPPIILFREDKMTTDWEEMLLMLVSWAKKPTITIKLKAAMKLALVRIWNFNASKRTLDFCMKQIRLRNGDKLIWSGKLGKGTGSLSYQPHELWLTDIPQVRSLRMK